MRKILVTGAAGFIGFHLSRRLLARGDSVAGVDNLNDYYSVQLKKDRLAHLQQQPGLRFEQLDVADQAAVARLCEREKCDVVVHLAAQVGVRYSLLNPQAYVHSNLVGFASILEACRQAGVQHLVYASSSSVYGANTKMPFSAHDPADHPLSLYAATKRANELMAHSYSHLYALPTTGLRFFTVYGPWGRPDMAVYRFTQAIVEGRPIEVAGEGKLQRDFTYVDDVVEALLRLLDRPARPNPSCADETDPATSRAPYRIYNIGSHRPVDLLYVIRTLERCLGKKAEIRMSPCPPGDMPHTFADVDDLIREVGFQPGTSIDEGLARFVEWYRGYHHV